MYARKILPVRDFTTLTLPVALLALLRALSAASAQSAIDVTIKDHRFTPSEIHVKAGQAVDLKIKNEDPLAEEFDSTALKIEKVIAGGQEAPCIFVARRRPLSLHGRVSLRYGAGRCRR
ncbi:MAG: cupredoxin domain-containing protein [Xanthobacteraceae bacterium]